jgi:hypothetical protein
MHKRRVIAYVLMLALAFVAVAPAGQPGQATKSENVILALVDGLRWQEVFSGADEALLNKENGGIENVDAVRQPYWRDSPEQRRRVLLPFLWGTVATQGQVFGNQQKDSVVRVSNLQRISYPGYSEMLVGFADPRIDSNDKRPNPNPTVLEWLNRQPRYKGRVAAFAAWDVVPFIFDRERCGFPVSGGLEPVTDEPLSPVQDVLNRLKADIPPRWNGEAFDALVFYSALEYLKQHKPRVFYVAFGETDEWAHEGRYADYLDAARRDDQRLQALWNTIQAIPEYQKKTTLVITADHGRGNAPQEWKSHGKKIEGSENDWIAIVGPDTPPLGERTAAAPLTLSQVAATLAAVLGEDYAAAVPGAAPPIPEVVGRTP